jgi:hypothetical protein
LQVRVLPGAPKNRSILSFPSSSARFGRITGEVYHKIPQKLTGIFSAKRQGDFCILPAGSSGTAAELSKISKNKNASGDHARMRFFVFGPSVVQMGLRQRQEGRWNLRGTFTFPRQAV